MSTEVSNAQVMPYEADHDIKTLLFLLQAAADSPSAGTEAAGDVPSSGAENGETAKPKWYRNPRAYARGIDKLVADLAAEKAKVAQLQKEVARLEQEKKDLIKQNEQEKKDLIKQNSQYKVDLAWEKSRHAELKAARDKEQNAAWEREKAAYREKKAREEAVIAAQKARDAAYERESEERKKEREKAKPPEETAEERKEREFADMMRIMDAHHDARRGS